MTPPIKRGLQTQLEMYHAAPTPMKKRRTLMVSPLIPCPQAGFIFNSEARRSFVTPTYRFLPGAHRREELRQQDVNSFKIKKYRKDRAEMDRLIPIDVLLRSIQDQAETNENPAAPVPIKMKVSPQVRRLKIRRISKKTRRINENIMKNGRSKKMKKPETGQLISAVVKSPPVTLEQVFEMIMTTSRLTNTHPEIITLMMIMKIHDIDPFPIYTAAKEAVELRRSILYREEGKKWLEHFVPGASYDDPNIPPIYKIFDNNDDGIPPQFLCHKNNNSPLEAYQSRVLIKRFLINGEIDCQEKFILGQIIGLREDEINLFFLKLHLDRTISGKSESELRSMVHSTYNDVISTMVANGEEVKDPATTYEEFFVPILNELFSE